MIWLLILIIVLIIGLNLISHRMSAFHLREAPLGVKPIQENSINSIRLKVTDRCPWQCNFCHDEGWRSTSDVSWTNELGDALIAIRSVLPTINSVHETGGEPTTNRHICEFNRQLAAHGFSVKMTTNGQFDAGKLTDLVASGVQSFNFSILSLDPERFLALQQGRGTTWRDGGHISGNALPEAQHHVFAHFNRDWAQRQIDQQLAMALAARKLNVSVKVNTVVSSYSDISNAWDVYVWAKQNSIALRLMNDLANGQESIDAIERFIGAIGGREISRHAERGTSTCKTAYQDKDGYEFAFKQIRNQKLKVMCAECPRMNNGTCTESFYGIRLQQDPSGTIYVILCIQESNTSTQMTVPEFLSSPHLKELQGYNH